MGQPTRVMIEIRDWPGLVTNADAHDLPPGAATEQVNLQSSQAGVLEARPGFLFVAFEDE